VKEYNIIGGNELEFETMDRQQQIMEKIGSVNKNKSLNYYIFTMGCQLNENDSEKLCGMCEAMGYSKTDDISNASLYIINTCCVRENAEEKVFGKIRRNKAVY